MPLPCVHGNDNCSHPLTCLGHRVCGTFRDRPNLSSKPGSFRLAANNASTSSLQPPRQRMDRVELRQSMLDFATPMKVGRN